MLALLVLLFALGGCGQLDRDNPVDPRVSPAAELRQQLIGSWSREDGEKNEVYTFKGDNRVELFDYSSPDGGLADRNASFPQTLVLVYSGTFRLLGDQLYLNFSQVQSNDPAGAEPALPDEERQVELNIRLNQLILKERDGSRVYFRL